MDTIITKTWSIEIDADEVFARCSNESLYQSYKRSDAKVDDMVLHEDDRNQFLVYFDAAIAGLYMLLARRMSSSPLKVENTNKIKFLLDMHDNNDDNILPVLINHCYGYVVKKVLEQWFSANLGSDLERLEINHCLHYRKSPVRRRIGPIF